jgi:uncharacterized GH25 family protein
MKSTILAILGLLIFCFVSHAHEFWLQADKFRLKKGESIAISFRVGENFMGEPWNLKKHRVERLQLLQQNRVQDLKSGVKEGDKNNVVITPGNEGTAMVVMESNPAFISLDGKSFNAYLEEDGLDEALSYREKMKLLDDSAKEFYSRHSKLLFQVGDKTDETYIKEVGLPVEIIPLKNPYTLKVGDAIRYKVLYNGKPLFGAKVKIWNRSNNRTTTQNIYTQQDGIIESRITSTGPWMVSFVKMVPSKDPKAQWRSYWASLVFGI